MVKKIVFFNKVFLAVIAFSSSTTSFSDAPVEAYWYDGDVKSRVWLVKDMSPLGSQIYTSSLLPGAQQLMLTDGIVVKTNEAADVKGIERKYEIRLVKSLLVGANNFLFVVEDSSSSISIANSIVENGDAVQAYPDWQYLEFEP